MTTNLLLPDVVIDPNIRDHRRREEIALLLRRVSAREKVCAGGLGVGEEAFDLDELRLGDNRLQLAVPAIAGRINITAPSNLRRTFQAAWDPEFCAVVITLA